MKTLSRVLLVSGLTVMDSVVMQFACAQDVWHPSDYDAFVLAGLTQSSYMGVNLADIDNERAHALKLRDIHGVEITRIEDGSPAAKAGLKVGDVVLEYNGQRVEGMEQFGRFVRETPVGRDVKLMISRDGTPQNISVTIGSRKDVLRNGEWSVVAPPGDRTFRFNVPEINIPMPDVPMIFQSSRMGVLGVEVEALSPQLADFFGVKDGVLVRAVVKDSAAEKAGIKAGDVITKVEQESITSPGELSSAVRAVRSKTTFPVQVFRDHHEIMLNVTVDKARLEQVTPPRARIVSAQHM